MHRLWFYTSLIWQIDLARGRGGGGGGGPPPPPVEVVPASCEKSELERARALARCAQRQRATSVKAKPYAILRIQETSTHETLGSSSLAYIAPASSSPHRLVAATPYLPRMLDLRF